MATTQRTDQSWEVDELGKHFSRLDPTAVVRALQTGLSQLHHLLFVRLVDDVQQFALMDSMMVVSPAVLEQRQAKSRLEIDAYCCLEVVDELLHRRDLVNVDADWLREWAFRCRLAEQHRGFWERRIEYYQGCSLDDRRLKLESRLQQLMPQTVHVPLVMFRLVPPAIRIVAALAFRDSQRAQQLRAEQIRLLPAIYDCHRCRGEVLDVGESCEGCGNPLWGYEWLQTDY